MLLCGACTVHVDGKSVRSCQTPIGKVAGKRILTLEGLGTPAKPHPLQQAFIDEQAVQCDYCVNGMIMQAKALLEDLQFSRSAVTSVDWKSHPILIFPDVMNLSSASPAGRYWCRVMIRFLRQATRARNFPP